jgi:hypothetical protein
MVSPSVTSAEIRQILLDPRMRVPKFILELTAKAFSGHHRRIRPHSHWEPKIRNFLRCSSGKASQTPYFMGNDKG